MARSPIKTEKESDLTLPSAETLEFDDATLRAEVCKKEGNDEYKKREFSSAIDFYTKGIQVNCEDEQLNAILYANRATAHFYLGNYQDALSDAEAARKLKPTYTKAIERGASACEQLHLYEEAITWCDDGLAIDENNQKLLELRTRCASENKIFQSPAEAVNESVIPPPAAQTLDFDDATLRAIAEVYKIDGNEEFGKKEFSSAVDFYTKGIEVKCKDEQLNAVLYTNRATAHFHLGDYHDALSDSKAARSTQPSYMKAIIRGASACEKLHLYEEAIGWCNEGLALLWLRHWSSEPTTTLLLPWTSIYLNLLELEGFSDIVEPEQLQQRILYAVNNGPTGLKWKDFSNINDQDELECPGTVVRKESMTLDFVISEIGSKLCL